MTWAKCRITCLPRNKYRVALFDQNMDNDPELAFDVAATAYKVYYINLGYHGCYGYEL